MLENSLGTRAVLRPVGLLISIALTLGIALPSLAQSPRYGLGNFDARSAQPGPGVRSAVGSRQQYEVDRLPIELFRPARVTVRNRASGRPLSIDLRIMSPRPGAVSFRA